MLILLDPDPISLGTFSPAPGMGLATWAGADVDDGPETAGDPPERRINSFVDLLIYKYGQMKPLFDLFKK